MHNESVIPQTGRRSLRYDFSASEVYELSLKLANKTKEFTSVTEEEKTIMSQYAAKLNEVKAMCNKLSIQVSDGWELREVDCDIEFNKPEQGKKTLTRRDNKQQIVERMEPWEWNLFTSVNADDGLQPDVKPVKVKKPRRRKDSMDISDTIEGMDVPKKNSLGETTDTDFENPNDLPFL